MLNIENLIFNNVGEIKPELNSTRQIMEFFPQDRYENIKKLRLNKYGKGPFCKFSIDKKYSKQSGVYVISINDVIQYVGECDDFFKRFGMGYGNISPRNCFEGGQLTNCRINSLILNSLKSHNPVHLYFLETLERFKIEHELILSLNPPWNKTSGKPSKIS
jgi:hypothetical protein